MCLCDVHPVHGGHAESQNEFVSPDSYESARQIIYMMGERLRLSAKGNTVGLQRENRYSHVTVSAHMLLLCTPCNSPTAYRTLRLHRVSGRGNQHKRAICLFSYYRSESLDVLQAVGVLFR